MPPMTTLERTNTRGTFFLAGGRIGAHESVVRRMDSLGLEIANHSWDHPDLTTLTTSQITAQLANTSTRIQQLTGDRLTLMRPPYGAHNSTTDYLAGQQGLAVILWSLDTVSYTHLRAHETDSYLVCRL